MSIFPWDTRGNRQHCGESHAYSRKYSRFARLRLLGFKTPYFRNLPSKNNTQLFFSVVYRLRVSSLVVSLWLLIMLLLIGDQQGSQRKRQVLRPAFFVVFRAQNDNLAIISHNRYRFKLFNKLYHTRIVLQVCVFFFS